jgi:DNA-binding MarR family transcriptional regulator
MERQDDAMSVTESGADIGKPEFEELAAFRYLLRRFLHFSENAVRAVGMTLHQHEALLAIRGFPGRDYVTMGELAERLQVKHNAAVGLVDRLAAEGLVERRAGETDRRQVYVALTARGEELLARLAAVHREELQRLGPQLHDQLGRLLGRDSWLVGRGS